MKEKQAKSAKAPKRHYDNSSREEQSARSQKAIIEALVALLVERKGGDVTFKEIAQRTGLAERSIYRFYEDKQALHKEMDRYLATYIESSVDQLRTMDVAEFARNAYRLFDRYESLVLAYLFSPLGREARQLFRKKLNALIEHKLSAEKAIGKSAKTSRRIAIICSLINAKIWHDLRDDFGYTGDEMGEAVEWAIRLLVREL